jgi:hypothetical protein
MEYIHQQQYPHEVIPMATFSDLINSENWYSLSTGNSKLDKKIANDLPLESFTLMDGENNAGTRNPILFQMTISNGVYDSTTI